MGPSESSTGSSPGLATSGSKSRAQSEKPQPADYLIEVHKRQRQLALFEKGQLRYTFRIALGFDPQGTKKWQGDGRTPEGEFRTLLKNPKSKFYRSVLINYPLSFDAERAFAASRIDKAARDQILRAHERGGIPSQATALGGDIYIHGGGSSQDWTAGCIALDNRDMDLIFALPVGVRVRIHP